MSITGRTTPVPSGGLPNVTDHPAIAAARKAMTEPAPGQDFRPAAPKQEPDPSAATEAKANIRGAAVLNIVNMCREHAGRTEFTDYDFQALRLMLLTSESIISQGHKGIIPAGFGLGVQTYQTAAMTAVSKIIAEELSAAVSVVGSAAEQQPIG